MYIQQRIYLYLKLSVLNQYFLIIYNQDYNDETRKEDKTKDNRI